MQGPGFDPQYWVGDRAREERHAQEESYWRRACKYKVTSLSYHRKRKESNVVDKIS
jgi:hypothetical protein